MSLISSVLPSVIVLGLLIIIHELGHFIACRLSGVKVEKFSIGFGPEIFYWQGRETRYALSLFPLGGFVKPAGESASEVTAQGGLRPGDYLSAPLTHRIFIVAAGVLMNYLLAFFLFTAIFMMGRPIPGTTLGGFIKGYPAEASGLQAGDRILEVGSERVQTWSELTTALEKSETPEVMLVVEREGRAIPIPIQPKVDEVTDLFGNPVKLKRLGITPHPEAYVFERYGLWGSLKRAWEIEAFLTVMTHKAIYYLLIGKLSMKTISGPIGIVAMTGDAARLGLPYLLQLTATLSVSLAVMNLLPIPALDGGHLLFLLIEGIRRKRVSLQAQERATQVGFVLLLVFAGFVIYNDLVNIEIFEKIKGLFPRAIP